MTLDQLIIRASEVSRGIMGDMPEGAAPLPAFIAQDAQGVTLPVLAGQPESDSDMGALFETVRTVFQQFGAVQYVAALHGWALEGKAVDRFQGGAITDHPDRREIISFVAADIHGNSRAGLCYILRPEHGKATLSPLKELPTIKGAAANLLKIEAPLAPASRSWGNTTRH